jgi:cellulose synthase (UDP-forming)
MSLYQTSRGLLYLFKGVGAERTSQRQDAKAKS